MSVWLENSKKKLSNDDRKHGVIDQGESRKRASKRKGTDRDYHVQDNADFSHKHVKVYWYTNQFP